MHAASGELNFLVSRNNNVLSPGVCRGGAEAEGEVWREKVKGKWKGGGEGEGDGEGEAEGKGRVVRNQPEAMPA